MKIKTLSIAALLLCTVFSTAQTYGPNLISAKNSTIEELDPFDLVNYPSSSSTIFPLTGYVGGGTFSGNTNNSNPPSISSTTPLSLGLWHRTTDRVARETSNPINGLQCVRIALLNNATNTRFGAIDIRLTVERGATYRLTFKARSQDLDGPSDVANTNVNNKGILVSARAGSYWSELTSNLVVSNAGPFISPTNAEFTTNITAASNVDNMIIRLTAETALTGVVSSIYHFIDDIKLEKVLTTSINEGVLPRISVINVPGSSNYKVMGDLEVAKVEVLNTTGNLVKTVTNSALFSMAEAAKGVYVVKVTDNAGKQYIAKIAKR